MMARFQVWAAVALLGLNTVTVIADGSCVPTCVNDVQNKNFQEIGCAAANQNGCLCVKQAFVDLVAECSQKCGATVDEIRQGLVGDNPPRFCLPQAAEVPAARASAGTSSPAASTSSPAASSPAPSTSSTSSSSTAPPSTSSPSPASTSPTPTSTSTSASTSSTVATPTTPSTTTTSNTVSSGAATSSHSSTSTAASGETSPASSPVPASGISSGAAAGIGIGVAIVVAAVAVIAFCLLRSRKKQAAPRHSMDISKPLPGSGRTYPARDDRGRDSDSYDKYGNDIEMTSNRYEDMIPSQQPRTMV